VTNQFRMTLWFKKGLLDAHEAEQAAQGEDPLHPGAVDLLPPEDRYLDDGSVTREDTRALGLHTGGTQMVAVLPDPPPATSDGLAATVRELSRGRFAAIGVLAAAMLAVCVMAIVYVT